MDNKTYDKTADTIAAVATPAIPSAIAILRISGPEAFSVLRKAFHARGKMAPRRLCLGDAFAPDGVKIDEAMAVRMPAPHSYTGENCAEIYTHGSPGVAAAVLETLLTAGARQAEPGEFTRRAFLNGRMDLSQSEAVIDLIDSQTRAAAENAAKQLSGALGTQIENARSRMIALTAQLSAQMDFPDEEVPEIENEQLLSELSNIRASLSRLYDSYDRGVMVKNGVPCVICGRPNAGKSSLLNAIAGFDRAIVTEIPGTTRDVIEQRVELSGQSFLFSDTAGLRESADTVERIGVERAKKALADAAAVIAVFDGAQPLSDEDRAILRELAGKTAFLVVNKADLPQKIDAQALAGTGFPVFTLCARTGEGVDALTSALASAFASCALPGESLVTNPRQKAALSRALTALDRAVLAVNTLTADVACTDIEESLFALGEITGQSASQEIIDSIFSRFCVGK